MPKKSQRQNLTITGLILLLFIVAGVIAWLWAARTGRVPTPFATPSAATATPLPDDSPAASPAAGDRVISSRVVHDWTWPGSGAGIHADHTVTAPIASPPAPPLP